MIHEIGHTFGLRHFFANISEQAWPSVVFGEHDPFTILNYGSQSVLTNADRDDLSRLYESVWHGTLTEINQTPIKLVKPFHTIGGLPVESRLQADAVGAVAFSPSRERYASV